MPGPASSSPRQRLPCLVRLLKLRHRAHAQVAMLGAVCDGFHAERGPEIDVPAQGQLFFPSARSLHHPPP